MDLSIRRQNLPLAVDEDGGVMDLAARAFSMKVPGMMLTLCFFARDAMASVKNPGISSATFFDSSIVVGAK